MTFFDELFDALPPHIKDDKDFSRLVKLFFDVIEDRYKLSNDALQTKMVDTLAAKYAENKDSRYYNRRHDLLKFHLNELFSAIEATYKDEQFFKRMTKDFEKLGMKPSDFKIEEKFLSSLNQSNINSNKSFNQNKGKLISFIYAFHIVSQSGLQGFNASNGFMKVLQNFNEKTKEPIPFSYRVESSLYKETFDCMIKPLVHPIGFGFSFATLLTFIFEDYFLVKEIKHLEQCFIRCLQPDGTYIETNMMEHEVVGFHETKTENTTEFWLKYKDKDTKELKKLIVSNDKVVRFYSLENLRIKSVRLANPMQGIIKEIVAQDGTIQAIDYHQYFINRNPIVRMYFTLADDKSNKEYETSIAYDPNDYSVVPGENYLQAKRINAAEILDNVEGTLDGRLVDELPRTCGLHYNIRVERITQVQEELLSDYKMNWGDYFARVPVTEETTTTFYVGKAVDPTKEPSEWMPLVGEYIITNKKALAELTDTSAKPLPDVDLLGKDEEWWFKHYPRYDTVIDDTQVSSSKPEIFNKAATGRDILLSQETLHILKNDLGSHLAPQIWKIGEFPIGEKYTDKEVEDFINGVTTLQTGERILTVGGLYTNMIADGDLYPTRDTEDMIVEISSVHTLADNIETNDSFDIQATLHTLDYFPRTNIGKDILKVDGNWIVGYENTEEHEKWKFVETFDITKHDIEFDTIQLKIGDYIIGNDYTDEQLEAAKFGEFTFTKEPVFIDFKFGKDVLHGDRYPMHHFIEELDIQVIRRA